MTETQSFYGRANHRDPEETGIRAEGLRAFVAKRETTRHSQNTLAMSERRACALVGLPRRITRYVSTRTDDAALRQRLRELAG